MIHIQPQSLGGLNELSNLAFACRRCNERRSNFVCAIAPDSLEEVALFNPRQQQWQDHFTWTADRLKILGITSAGRATCQRLDMNDEMRSPAFIQASQHIWIRMNLHPPATDPRLPP